MPLRRRAELLTPGSLLLGNPHDSFECGHEHGTGDRCLAFGYSAEMFEQLAFEAGVRGAPRLRGLRVPPIARPCAARCRGIGRLGSRAR